MTAASARGGVLLLTIEVDLHRITAMQNYYLAQGTRRGAGLANKVRLMRDLLRHGARRFGERQRAAAATGGPLLADGLPATLEREVLAPLAPNSWPRRAAAVLHGLALPGQALLPADPCRRGGPTWRDLDPDSYLTRLNAGPPQERSFGDMTSLVLYLAPQQRLRIVWIGEEGDVALGEEELKRATAGFTSWKEVDADYAAWLARACRPPS